MLFFFKNSFFKKKSRHGCPAGVRAGASLCTWSVLSRLCCVGNISRSRPTNRCWHACVFSRPAILYFCMQHHHAPEQPWPSCVWLELLLVHGRFISVVLGITPHCISDLRDGIRGFFRKSCCTCWKV